LNSVNSEEVLAHGQTEWKVIYMWFVHFNQALL
jgi:hypothetical protein